MVAGAGWRVLWCAHDVVHVERILFFGLEDTLVFGCDDFASVSYFASIAADTNPTIMSPQMNLVYRDIYRDVDMI